MGRQSHQAPFPIATRTSSVNAEAKMRDERRLPRQTSQGNMRMAPEKNKAASSQQSNAPENPAFHRELRVRASSPLLGRSYQSHRPPTNHSYRQPTRDSQQQPLPQGSRSYFPRDPNFDKYAFDTQSQRSLALGVVDDMRGIGFPLLEQRSETASQRKEQRLDNGPKKRPSRLDLSLLFPKPKPEPAPLLSPQRYTKSPSPVTSEFSTKAPPNKLIKPRSRGNIRAAIKEISPPIPLEPPVPPTRVSTRKPAVDWFDVPLEKIIRLGETLEVDAADENSNHETFKIVLDNSYEPKQARHSRTVKPSQPPMETVVTQASSAVQSHRSSLTSSTASRQESRRNHDSRTLQHRQPQSSTGGTNRPRASLQSWQSEGDLRSAQLKPVDRLLKRKKSSSTFETLDLTKNSVLSLSSSEDEEEEEDENTGIRNATPVNDAGKNYQTHLARKDAGSRGPRESFATNDYIEPEICRAEAVVARKGLPLSQLGRTNSTMSQVSSDSYSTQRRPIPMRPDSFSSISRSTISMKIYAPPYLDVPLIEEPEEQVEKPKPNTRQLRLSSQFNNDPHSVKRRSRIIAVTRQEESLLEAMRLRDGRLTPSIFRDISDSASDTSAQDRGQTGSTTPALTSAEPVQNNQFDTSFLRLSAVMQTPPIGASSSTESASAGENDTYLSYRPVSASDQRTEQSNSHFTASPRLSLAYSETPSSSSTMGHASPVTPTLLPVHRFSQQAAAPPPSYAPPPVPDDASSRGHSRRRTDSSEAIVLEETEAAKLPNPAVYPLWAVKWTRDPENMAVAH